MEQNLKYPLLVYSSVRVDPSETKLCTDLKTDYLLCINKKSFMQEPETENKIKPRPNIPDGLFKSKTISDGTLFYTAEKSRSCTFLNSEFKKCFNKVRSVYGVLTNSNQFDHEKFKNLDLSSKLS